MASIGDEQLLAAAITAARQAAKVMLEERKAMGERASVKQEKASPQDIVTAADMAAQNAIYATLQNTFRAGFDDGSIGFLGEESVEPGSDASAKAIAQLANKDVLFVVDPLDGTTMFAHDIALYTVSIGIARKGIVTAGVVYHPALDELFYAVKGQGAWLVRAGGASKEPLRVSPEPLMRNALWAFGLHSVPAVTATMLNTLRMLTEVSRGARCLGSAALHLAYVAAGRFTAFTELDLNAWDLSAGALIVQEAGGRVGDTRGQEYTLLTRDIVASNGAREVHEGALYLMAHPLVGTSSKWSPEEAVQHGEGRIKAVFEEWKAKV